MTTGRDWYPVIFAELDRIGATDAGLGVREIKEGEPEIWIEFFTESGGDSWVCSIDEAVDFLDAISDGEAQDLDQFDFYFNDVFGIESEGEFVDDDPAPEAEPN